jgi:hypothetical protein
MANILKMDAVFRWGWISFQNWLPEEETRKVLIVTSNATPTIK